MLKLFLILFLQIYLLDSTLVINTWNFSNATKKAWEILRNGGNAIDAVTEGCTVCQDEQCDFTVGFGGSPDENGETTLDAMVFDGTEMDMGSVGGIRRIKNAIKVARDVLQHTEHSILVGDLATEFAKNLGYKEETLSTDYSINMYKNWKAFSCQPNFWKDVSPDPKNNCGPYKKLTENDINYKYWMFDSKNHDTISMIALDINGNIVAGTSSNGAKYKIPGRMGDAPLPGAGAYADSEIGGAAATGDGDIMMRFLPSFVAVEEMKKGSTPEKASQIAIERIANKYPSFMGGVIAINKNGEYGAACHGVNVFPYCIGNNENNDVAIKYIKC